MKKYLLLLLIILISGAKVFALYIVYPKKNPATVNANSTFFIGSTNPADTLKINDEEVKVSEIGAFAHTVLLKPGKNIFEITSTAKDCTKSSIIFVIEKPNYQNPAKQAFLKEYSETQDFTTLTDNIPLRSSPADSGINRLAYLPKYLDLKINGERGDFYRVFLNPCTVGWVMKSDIEKKIKTPVNKESVKINNFTVEEDNEFLKYEFDLSKKTPFVAQEISGLRLHLYNVSFDDNLFSKYNYSREMIKKSVSEQRMVYRVEKRTSENPFYLTEKDCTLTLDLPFLSKLMGYDVYYDNNKLILKIRKEICANSKCPLKNITIAVDAGHGGDELGAIGGCGDKEKDINLAIAKNLQQELLARGANVVMTRDCDIAVSLADRVKIAKDNNAVISVSIHANALPDGQDPLKNKGSSVYYYHNQAKPLADNILISMVTKLKTKNDRVKQASLALVRPTTSVSILIEVGYIINPDDYTMLLNKDFQMNCAKAIADGIENYLLK